MSALFHFFNALFLLHYTNETTKITTASSTDMMAAGIEDVTCYLLQLPGELRNRIYRMVLTDGMPIINFDATGYVRPGLLSTCKEIRQEALSIYYYENKFRTRVENFDSTTLHNFKHTLVATRLSRDHITVTFSFADGAVPNWSNLLEWLRLYHAKAIRTKPYLPDNLRQQGNVDGLAHALGTLFQVVKSLRAQRWKVVKKTLEDLPSVLWHIDERWMS